MRVYLCVVHVIVDYNSCRYTYCHEQRRASYNNTIYYYCYLLLRLYPRSFNSYLTVLNPRSEK